jgi:hypothetical protein
MARDAEMNGEFFTVTTAYYAAHVFAGVVDRGTANSPLSLAGHRNRGDLRAEKMGFTAYLEIRSIKPERARLATTETDYRSHFHPMGTIEAKGCDVAAQVIAWLDEEAAKPA